MKKFLYLVAFLAAFNPLSVYAFELQHCQIAFGSVTDTLAKFCEVPRAAYEITIQNSLDNEIQLCDSGTAATDTYVSDCWPIIAENQLAAEVLSADNPTSLYIEYTGSAPTTGKLIITWKKR